MPTVDEVSAWCASVERQRALGQAREDAERVIERLQKAREVNFMDLLEPITFKTPQAPTPESEK